VLGSIEGAGAAAGERLQGTVVVTFGQSFDVRTTEGMKASM
jgi:hypothetical protein